MIELGDDYPLAKEAIAAIKAKDKARLVALIPKIAVEVKEDIAAIKPVVSTAKVGYKTTEFWLIAAFLGFNVWYLQKTGNALPLELNTVIAAVTSVYTVIRGILKKQTPQAPTRRGA